MKAPALVPLLFVAFLLAGCEDEPSAPLGTDADPVIENLEPGIHPVFSIPDLELWTPGRVMSVSMHLKSVDVPEHIQSFQGSLIYDHGVLHIENIRVPDGMLGAFNEAEKGHIRFAGVALDGLDGLAAIEMTLTSARPIEAADFQVVLDEVVGGTDVAQFVNVTSDVIDRPSPILTRMRLSRN